LDLHRLPNLFAMKHLMQSAQHEVLQASELHLTFETFDFQKCGSISYRSLKVGQTIFSFALWMPPIPAGNREACSCLL